MQMEVCCLIHVVKSRDSAYVHVSSYSISGTFNSPIKQTSNTGHFRKKKKSTRDCASQPGYEQHQGTETELCTISQDIFLPLIEKGKAHEVFIIYNSIK